MLVEQILELNQTIRNLKENNLELEKRLKLLEEGDSRVIVVLENIKEILNKQTGILIDIYNKDVAVVHNSNVVETKIKSKKIKEDENIFIPKIDITNMEMKSKDNSVITENDLTSNIEKLEELF